MSDIYLGEIIKSRGGEVVSDDGDYRDPATDAKVITFIIDYVREQDYLDVSKLSDQELYDIIKDYLDRRIPAYLFMEDLEHKYGVKS